HLAAAVGVRLIVEQPGRTLLTNVQGAENVLEYCARFEKPVLIASSSEVYGNHPADVLLEEDAQRIYGPTTAKRWAYADTKALDDGEIYNVGSTDRITIRELSKRVLEATGSSSELAFVTYEEVYEGGVTEEMFHRAPAIGKIKQAIGWEPTLGLDRILADVIESVQLASAG